MHSLELWRSHPAPRHPTLSENTFSSNTATEFDGGGLCVPYTGDADLSQTTVSENIANNGGCLNWAYSDGTISMGTFTGNTAVDGGG